MQMNVLHVLDHSLPIHSGYSFRAAEILAAQRDIGLSVVALTGPKHDSILREADKSSASEYERSTFRSAFLSKLPVIGQEEVIRSLCEKIRTLMQEQQFDVIHAHSPSLNGIAAIRAAKLTSRPVVYEMRASWEDAAVDHGTTSEGSLRYRLSRALESRVFRRVNAITTICEGLKADIVERGIDEGMVTVVPNAVDAERFYPRPENKEALRQEYDVSKKFVIAFCGSFYSYEGLDVLLAALPKLRESLPEAVVILAGGGEEENRLQEIVSKNGITEMVRFLGRVKREAVVDIYNLADVCAYPRHRMKLTEMVTPLKPLEAMATGAVVLASDVGGHKELIREGVTGFFFKAESNDSLCSSLLKIAAMKDLQGIRDAARDFICSERTWKSSVARYPGVYRHAISNRNLK